MNKNSDALTRAMLEYWPSGLPRLSGLTMLICGMGGSSVQTLDDADVAHGAVAERFQRFLVAGTVIGGERLFDAGKFGNDDAFFLSGFESGRRTAAHDVAAAERCGRFRRHLRIGGELFWIGNRAVAGHPVAFGHRNSPKGCGSRWRVSVAPRTGAPQIDRREASTFRPSGVPSIARARCGARTKSGGRDVFLERAVRPACGRRRPRYREGL